MVSDKMRRVLEQETDTFGTIGHGSTYWAHPIAALLERGVISRAKLQEEILGSRHRIA